MWIILICYPNTQKPHISCLFFLSLFLPSSLQLSFFSSLAPSLPFFFLPSFHRDILSTDYSPNSCNSWDRTRPKGKSRGTQSGLPCRWQGPDCLGYHLLPPKGRINRKLELGLEWGLQPRHSNMGAGHSNWWRNCWTKYHPVQSFKSDI